MTREQTYNRKVVLGFVLLFLTYLGTYTPFLFYFGIMTTVFWIGVLAFTLLGLHEIRRTGEKGKHLAYITLLIQTVNVVTTILKLIVIYNR